MYSTELKIKRLSLGLEARLIRQEERRMKAKRKTSTLNSLHFHRKGIVRPAARAAHLAHTFLRGQPYAKAEDPQRTKSNPRIVPLMENIRTFGGAQFRSMDKKDLWKSICAWIDGGAPVGLEASNPRLSGSTPAAVANA